MIIAIAQDEAFNFVYRANIDWLKAHGEVVFFSPLRDAVLPQCDFLYLPGGYPELFASELSANVSMRDSIRAYAESGGRVLAECGGYMYLCRDIDGVEMCGVLPMSITMKDARLHLGYRQWAGSDGQEQNGDGLRGHEFHYSTVVPTKMPDGITIEQCQLNAKGKQVDTPLYRYKNVVAGYTHWYWAEKGLDSIYVIRSCLGKQHSRAKR